MTFDKEIRKCRGRRFLSCPSPLPLPPPPVLLLFPWALVDLYLPVLRVRASSALSSIGALFPYVVSCHPGPALVLVGVRHFDLVEPRIQRAPGRNTSCHGKERGEIDRVETHPGKKTTTYPATWGPGDQGYPTSGMGDEGERTGRGRVDDSLHRQVWPK